MGKYHRWYNQLMRRAKGRVLDQYSEGHHVIPKSLGGEGTTIVRLTYREHFLAHWLLTKMHRGEKRRKMLCALVMMSCRVKGRGHRITSWQYAAMRKAAHVAAKGRVTSDESRAKMRKSQSNRGPVSESTRVKMSLAHLGNQHLLGHKHSKKSRAKISATLRKRFETQDGWSLGKKLPETQVAKIKAGVRRAYDEGNLREARKRQASTRERGSDGRWA